MGRKNTQFMFRKKCLICDNFFEKSKKLSYLQFSKKETCCKLCWIKSISSNRSPQFGKTSWNKGGTSWSKGQKMNIETRLKISKANTGKKRSIESRLKLSKSKIGVKNLNNSGEKCHFWKGGITPINAKIRMSTEMRLWRRAVFERDNYTCQICKQYGGKLNADHIKPFSLFYELRYNINNGRTLCVDCHRKTDTYGGKIIKTYAQEWVKKINNLCK